VTPFAARGSRSPLAAARALAAALVAALAFAAGGCRGDEPRLDEDADIAKTKAAAAPRGAKLAIAPVETSYPESYDLDRDSSRYPAKVDAEALREGLRNAIATYTGFERPAAVSGARFEDAFAPAAEAGADVLLRPVFERLDCVWRGHNGRWVPNILLFIYAWVPSFWVADEDYALEGTLALRWYSVSSQRELYTKRVEIDVEWPLDDFERGWSWTGIITVPATVNANDWGIVSESLARLLRFHCEKAVVLDAGTALPAFLATREFASLDASVHALVVGISKYAGGVSGASGASADAARVEALLTGAAGVPAKNVARIEDDRATYQAIEALLQRTLARTRPDDTALVYWSGLGAVGADGGRYLLPKDVDPRSVERTSFSLARLRELISKAPARRAVVVLDASFGGRRPGSRSLLRGPDATLATSDEPLVTFTGGRDGKDVTLWSAASPGEDALDLEGEGRGLMSFILEEGAAGRADEDRSGTVTVRELFEWVDREVPAQAGLDGGSQRPRLYRAGARAAASDAGSRESWLPNSGGSGGVAAPR
jgi:hypothetical protein